MRKLTVITRGNRHFAVSTVYATIHPIGWETMVFHCDEVGNVTDWCEVVKAQYSNEAEAIAGHDKMIATFQVN